MQLTAPVADRLDRILHGRDHALPALPYPHYARDCGDVGVDVGEPSRRQPKKSHARLQDGSHRLQLVGDRRQHEVGTGRENLLRLGGPGVGDDQARAIRNFGTDVGAILRAGDQAIEQARDRAG